MSNITGDSLAISGAANIGGSATIQGNTIINHNLVVRGWLDAVNVRDIYKGVFSSSSALSAAFPNPKDGWIAGVGSAIPYTAYIGQNGSWINTGSTYTPTGDTIDVDAIYTAIGLKYTKPVGGIPKTDLAAAVQTSLNKADSALQQHQDVSGKANKSDVYTKEQVVQKLGLAVGETVRATYNFASSGKKILCSSADLLLIVINGVGFIPMEINVPSGLVTASFVFKNPSLIPQDAFKENTDIIKIHIPSCVHEIKSGAFRECENLINVECESMTPPKIETDSFSDVTGCTLKVHNVVLQTYSTDEFWGTFQLIETFSD